MQTLIDLEQDHQRQLLGWSTGMGHHKGGLDPKRWSQQTWMLGLVYDKLVFETVHLFIGNWACIL